MNLAKSIGILVALALSRTSEARPDAAAPTVPDRNDQSLMILKATRTAAHLAKLVDGCCQVGRARAIESQKFNCKLSARDALVELASQELGSRASSSLATSVDRMIAREPSFADQCEMVLESCCLAHHRTRNCDSGKQFAKSGAACMDVELSKEATVATESFNDCCMSCSLGILAARNPSQNESSLRPADLASRCKLMSPLASSLSGQLYEQTYVECCHENLPRPSSTLLEPGAPIDCGQANACSQRCLPAGSPDPITGQRLDRDRCDCFSGYKLAPDGLTCVDVDECKLNLHTCHKSELCDNTRGSFRCLARLHQPARSLALGAGQADEPAEPLADQPSGPFASLRLCPAGSRWLAAEARCQPAQADSNQRPASARLGVIRRISSARTD